MKKRGIVSKLLGGIILGGFLVFYIVSAILDLVSLANARTVDSYDMDISEDGVSVEGNFYYLTNGHVLSVEHKICYVIPTGTEYFFTLFNDSGSKCIFIRADKDFAEEFYRQVDENEQNGSYAGAYLKGKVREMRPKVRYELVDYANELAGEGCLAITSGNTFLFIDLTAKFQGILRLITVLFFMAGAVAIIFVIKRKANMPLSEAPRPIAIVVLLLVLIGIGLMMYTMTFLVMG